MKKEINHTKAVVSRCPMCNRILVSDLSITRGHGKDCYIGKLERDIEKLQNRLEACVALIDKLRGK